MKKQTRAGIYAMLLFAAVLLCIFAASCAKGGNAPTEDDTIALNDCKIEHNEEKGGVYIKCPIEEFQQLGFEYGDSVNIIFSNE